MPPDESSDAAGGLSRSRGCPGAENARRVSAGFYSLRPSPRVPTLRGRRVRLWPASSLGRRTKGRLIFADSTASPRRKRTATVEKVPAGVYAGMRRGGTFAHAGDFGWLDANDRDANAPTEAFTVRSPVVSPKGRGVITSHALPQGRIAAST
jgi:hypothetical protein